MGVFLSPKLVFMSDKKHLDTISAAGLLVAMGIIYGDIGTSPLYTLRAIIGPTSPIKADVVRGALSCVFWTLTLQTTVKYVILILRADNRGEGGIFCPLCVNSTPCPLVNPTGYYWRVSAISRWHHHTPYFRFLSG